jgi:N-acetylated-alpha-linked acidic dipeptidase
MRKLPLLAACSLAALAAPSVAAVPGKDEAREAQFDAAISPAELEGWLRDFASAPNHVGSPHNKANAEKTLAQFREWGWDAKIETYDVLYPTPVKIAADLLGAEPFSATLKESPIAGDDPTNTDRALPPYLAYQGDGDVTAPLVYVNYGMPDDYDALERMGVSVKGKIVIARYGAGWRGLKPKLAQEHGAVGCIIYSDPADDGYATGLVYPDGPERPAQGVQRGSVADMPLYAGDPLTPGYGSTPKAKRISRGAAKMILKIPALPMSYGDAQRFLAAMGGQLAPPSFRGALGLTYRIGDDGGAKAHLVVKSDWSQKTIHDVVATVPGSEHPDEWILRGNHRDGWVMGASDPLAGHVAMMGEAKAIGALLKSGWKPKRTLVYLSWDAEEPGLIGSTEWAETHSAELQKKALLYINTDTNARGFLFAGGGQALQHFVSDAAKDVTDPQTKVSVDARARAQLQAAALSPGAGPDDQKNAEIAGDPGRDVPIVPLGSGSDFTPFLQHVGIATLHIGFGGEDGSGGVYHSLYDDFAHHSRFVDPGSEYGGALAKTIGRLVLRASDADIPVVRYGDFASAVAGYLSEVKELADGRRTLAEAQEKAIAGKAFLLAADPTKPSAPPRIYKTVPHFNFAPLEDAVARLAKSAAAYDAALSEKGDDLPASARTRLFALAREAEQALLIPQGLPGRPWFKHAIYAPGTLTGYGTKTMPGVREAIEQERFSDVDRYAALTAQALERYADTLDEGVKAMGK